MKKRKLTIIASAGLLTYGFYNIAKSNNTNLEVLNKNETSIFDYNNPQYHAPENYYLSEEAILKPTFWEIVTAPITIFKKKSTVQEATNDNTKYTPYDIATKTLSNYINKGILDKTTELSIISGEATAETLSNAFKTVSNHFKKYGLLYVILGFSGIIITKKILK